MPWPVANHMPPNSNAIIKKSEVDLAGKLAGQSKVFGACIVRGRPLQIEIASQVGPATFALEQIYFQLRRGHIIHALHPRPSCRLVSATEYGCRKKIGYDRFACLFM